MGWGWRGEGRGARHGLRPPPRDKLWIRPCLNPGSGVSTRSNPGFEFGFWIFTNKNGEAVDGKNFTENAFMEGIVTVQTAVTIR